MLKAVRMLPALSGKTETFTGNHTLAPAKRRHEARLPLARTLTRLDHGISGHDESGQRSPATHHLPPEEASLDMLPFLRDPGGWSSPGFGPANA